MGVADSQRRHEDDLTLFQLPDECRDYFEHAANSGLGRSAREYWESALAGESDFGGPIMLERVVGALISAHPPSNEETRTAEVRLRDAISAIVGSPLPLTNARNDDHLLREMIDIIEWDELPDDRLRSVARTVLSQHPPTATEESAVRRLVGKYKALRRGRSQLSSGVDDLDAFAQYRALHYVQKALAAIGIPTKI